MTSHFKNYKYIYDLPYIERMKLCKILNRNNKWKELAGIWMGYNVNEIQNLRKEPNPTDELLAMWGHHNHTILELFILLSKMEHYQSMVPLKPFVDNKYYILLYHRGRNFKNIFWNELLRKDTKDLKIGVQNFNHNEKPRINTVKVVMNNTNEESIKILNQPIQLEQENEIPSISNNLLISMPVIFSTLLPRISYNELSIATNNWENENILGKGGFGTVFKGIWKNTEVAIKKLESRSSNCDESYALQLEQSLHEIKILNSLPHDNILPLYGYSIGGEAPCLIYQWMKNGSLEDQLHSKQASSSLSWLKRQEIAKGLARGLQYLHTIHKKPLIHGDIKSANILLDKNFEPKIGDFGLAREGSPGNFLKVSKIQGTRPYLPEEYIFDKSLSTKIDTYSYGIVLFELATGLSVYNKYRPMHKCLKEYVDSFDDKDLHLLKDKQAGENYEEVYNYLMLIGKWCSNKLAIHRPEMSIVYEKFKN